MRYKFNESEHIHQIQVEEDKEFRPLIGTSTAVGVIAKPGLTWWAAGMAVGELGWTPAKDKKTQKYVPKEQRTQVAEQMRMAIATMSGEEYVKLLDTAYYAHNTRKNDSAKDGTDLHAEAEKWVKAQMAGTPIEIHPQLKPLAEWAEKNVDKWLWSEMHCFSKEHWVGGITDAGFIDKEGKIGVMDFKSSKEAYTSQFIQCAGYDVQISENGGYDKDGNKVFSLPEGKTISYYAVLPFGMEKPEVQTRYNLEDLKKGFVSAVILHRLNN